MNLIELSKYLQDEEAAEKYLYEKGILKKFVTCPYCGSEKIGNIRRSRMKCYKCKKEWHKRKGSFLEGRQISFSKFIAFIKLYDDEIGVNQIAHELELDIKSGLTLHSELRKILIQNFEHSSFIKSTRAILFDHRGELKLQFISEKEFPQADKYYVLEFKRYKEFGSLYSFLVQAKWIGKNKSQQAFFNSFLSYAKMKLISYRGIKIEFVADYLVELVKRYNNRHNNFYEIILNTLKVSRVADFPVAREMPVSLNSKI